MRSAVTLSFRQEMLTGIHDLLSDTVKLALYASGSDVAATTSVYGAATNEVPPGSGYAAGGNTVTGKQIVTDAQTVVFTFSDVEWPAASFTARYALLYNATKANRSIAVFDLLIDRTGTGAAFKLEVPPATASSGLVRFAS
jgi:hypothetical protein